MVLDTCGCRGLRTQAVWPAVVLPSCWALLGRRESVTAFLKKESSCLRKKTKPVCKRMILNTDFLIDVRVYTAKWTRDHSSEFQAHAFLHSSFFID